MFEVEAILRAGNRSREIKWLCLNEKYSGERFIVDRETAIILIKEKLIKNVGIRKYKDKSIYIHGINGFRLNKLPKFNDYGFMTLNYGEIISKYQEVIQEYIVKTKGSKYRPINGIFNKDGYLIGLEVKYLNGVTPNKNMTLDKIFNDISYKNISEFIYIENEEILKKNVREDMICEFKRNYPGKMFCRIQKILNISLEDSQGIFDNKPIIIYYPIKIVDNKIVSSMLGVSNYSCKIIHRRTSDKLMNKINKLENQGEYKKEIIENIELNNNLEDSDMINSIFIKNINILGILAKRDNENPNKIYICNNSKYNMPKLIISINNKVIVTIKCNLLKGMLDRENIIIKDLNKIGHGYLLLDSEIKNLKEIYYENDIYNEGKIIGKKYYVC